MTATMFLLVGLPGAGKSTEAYRLAREHRAVRLSPDEWMIPLFGESDPDGKRDVMEGRLLSVGFQALKAGTSVVVDFGLWGRGERASLQALAAQVGAVGQVVYLDAPDDELWRRIEARFAETPEATFPFSRAEFDECRALIEVPTAAELDPTSPIPEPADGSPSWAAWATERWPSLVLEF